MEEVLRQAIEDGVAVELTIDPPSGESPFAIKARPTCLTRSGLLTCELPEGQNWTIYTEFISHAEVI